MGDESLLRFFNLYFDPECLIEKQMFLETLEVRGGLCEAIVLRILGFVNRAPKRKKQIKKKKRDQKIFTFLGFTKNQ